ncbi:MAG: hypothetical protein ACYDCQ_18545, partial [Dehalococcoidia bacterium]
IWSAISISFSAERASAPAAVVRRQLSDGQILTRPLPGCAGLASPGLSATLSTASVERAYAETGAEG